MRGAGGSAPCRVWAEPSVLFRTVQQVARCSARLILRNARASGLRPSNFPAPQRAKKTQAHERQRRNVCAHISTTPALRTHPKAFPSAEGAVGEGGCRRQTDEGMVLPIGKNLGAPAGAAKGGTRGGSNHPSRWRRACSTPHTSPRCRIPYHYRRNHPPRNPAMHQRRDPYGL